MPMFTALVGTYKMKLDQFQPKAKGFQDDEIDVRRRQKIQEDLINGFKAKLNPRARKPDAIERQKKIQERIRLFEKQSKFTQGAQDLNLQKQEIEYLLTQLQSGTPVDFEPHTAKVIKEGAAKQLTVQLNQVNLKLAQLQREKQAEIKRILQEQVKNNPVPTKSSEFSKDAHTAGALTKQQMLLEFIDGNASLRENIQKDFQAKGKLNVAEFGNMLIVLGNLRDALLTARNLLVAHGLVDETRHGMPRYGTDTLGVRGGALEGRVTTLGNAINKANKSRLPEDINALGGQVAIDELQALSTDVPAFIKHQQHAVQTLLTRQIKAAEQAAQLRAAYPLLKAFLKRNPNSFTTEHERKLASDPLRRVMSDLLASKASLQELGEAIATHTKQAELDAYLVKLRQVIDNDVVQGPFLLDQHNHLVQRPANDGDTDFFALTQSAEGDYNAPKNLGKYTYHVTALSNILRTVDAGIATQGLSPNQGGKMGGSCEIADKTKDFSNTGVDIKEGSIVNSQNKVAASSNRNEAMRVYIKQREDHVQTQMDDAKALEAALNTATMLRFPIRAQYLGKFDKDPMHLTSNLELLDGTPVPPEDIECLVHKAWVPITNPSFLATFKEMFGLV